MSVEDRLRAAARSRTDLVTGIRPLELPDELPGPARRTRLARRWNGWLIPLAAAVAVIAVAATLVAVRQASTSVSVSGSDSDPASAPAPAASYTTVPRYYAAITGSQDAAEVIVGDDHTGKQVATVAPPKGESFVNVTGAADDRTFALTAQVAPQSPTTASSNLYVWYLLRIAPGTPHPYQLARLPIEPLRAAFPGAALSPDGQELAVLSSSKTGAGSGAATDLSTGTTMMQVYSVSSGALLRTWTANEEVWANSGGGAQFSSFSWLADGRHLAFTHGTTKGKIAIPQERLLDVTAPSGDLLAVSQVILTLPQPAFSRCDAVSITPDGGTVICGTQQTGAGSHADCARLGSELIAYSVRTGKPVRVLYRDPQGCVGDTVAVPLWAALSAEHVIVLLRSGLSATGVEVGLVAGGRFTKFPPAAQSRDLYSAAF